ncbi:GAF and ANTAR domain-containing protein [Actinorugispora endophytica]|uniref:ANTAR domain-containing protein n=1 Tax=Actinorugispora endophytica TaxID=1605990 RepID=A0A4R6V3W5_9ACTN|nr:GAF and ANTAR domain-containing protein [Actinorugispora endophytica]TDQ55075.1 ANTAR domain-containing protein [Actinorugispora endophytica]
MWVERLARDIGALAQAAEGAPGRALDQVSLLAARGIPGCSAALVVIWRDVHPEEHDLDAEIRGRHVVVDYGASHSDLATAFEHQYATDQGPAVQAVRERRTVVVDDVLRSDRWPDYTSMAVQCGDRSSVTYPCDLAGEVMTFGVHSCRADGFVRDEVVPMLAMLAEHTATALRSADRNEDAIREAVHMRRAMTARAVIDQAKGILMHARGLSSQEAFDELRRVAQRNGMKVADVARRLMVEQATSSGRDR